MARFSGKDYIQKLNGLKETLGEYCGYATLEQQLHKMFGTEYTVARIRQ